MYAHSMFPGSLKLFVSIPMIDITPAFANSSSRLSGVLPAVQAGLSAISLINARFAFRR
jgi:hypothetical protein